jgi:hypothetical protein
VQGERNDFREHRQVWWLDIAVDTAARLERLAAAPHEGQKPRPLHENATTISPPHCSHRTVSRLVGSSDAADPRNGDAKCASDLTPCARPADRPSGPDLSVISRRGETPARVLMWTWRDATAHVRRSREAFAAGSASTLARLSRLLLILPLIVAHGVGAFIGYRRGPGASAHQLA